MVDPLGLVVLGILVALLFDFGNGFNDAANSVSTVVATKVLTLPQAVVLAAFANFVAAFVFGVAVANTVGKGILDASAVSPIVVIGALAASAFWVFLMTHFGLPISASHSLIGGLIGSGVAAKGLTVLNASGIINVVGFILLAPLIGLVTAVVFSIIVLWIARKTRPSKANKYFKKLQLVSVFSYSLSHGTNDAQKTMGVISLLLFSAGFLGGEFHVPFWVVIISHLTIALGTLAGGWKVVKTLGMKLTNLKPFQGFCAESAGAFTIMTASVLGIPVSTTHVIAGSIAGVGITKRTTAVRWGIARKIMLAWVTTIPFSAGIGAVSYFVFSAVLGA